MVLRFNEEVALSLHCFNDAAVLGAPDKPLYLTNENEWMVKNRGIRYKVNPDVVAMGLAARSLFLVSQYIQISEVEAQAITYHDGQYIDGSKTIAHKEEPLTLLLHWADYWTAHIYEEGRDNQLT